MRHAVHPGIPGSIIQARENCEFSLRPFLALLFNLMGNALNFQQRFANVKENEENQDYVGVYREYGYLVHLTYDFEPLPEAALRDINGYAKKFVTHHAGHLSEFQQTAFIEGVTKTADLIGE